MAYDDTCNPFYHPYHPDHDGWVEQGTNGPVRLSGDNFQNYIGENKPELFSISNTVSMGWNFTNQTAAASALWNPEERVEGSYVHTVHGLRRDADIRMGGAFVLRRVSKVGTISTNTDN